MHRIPAIMENRSTHCEMSLIGGLAGVGRPRVGGCVVSSGATSDISNLSDYLLGHCCWCCAWRGGEGLTSGQECWLVTVSRELTNGVGY